MDRQFPAGTDGICDVHDPSGQTGGRQGCHGKHVPADDFSGPGIKIFKQRLCNLDRVMGMKLAANGIVLVFVMPANDAQVMAEGTDGDLPFIQMDTKLFQTVKQLKAYHGHVQRVVGDGCIIMMRLVEAGHKDIRDDDVPSITQKVIFGMSDMLFIQVNTSTSINYSFIKEQMQMKMLLMKKSVAWDTLIR